MSEARDRKALKLQALQERFSKQLPARITALREHWQRLMAAPTEASLRHEFHRQVHSLAGASGTFGYDALGREARDLEKALTGFAALIDEADKAVVARRVDALEQLAQAGVTPSLADCPT